MIITCAISQNVSYMDADGVIRLCTLRPGKHNYQMLRPKEDHVLASTLFTLRKHKAIYFDDMLPQDNDPDVAKKASLKPSPVGRSVNITVDEKSRTEEKNVKGHRKKNSPAAAAWKDADNSRKPGKLPDKVANTSS